MEANLGGTGLTVASRGMLEQLHRDGPQSVPQLGRALLVPRQFAQKMVNTALGSGLVEVRPNPAHRRSPLIELTAAGTQGFTQVKEREMASLRGCGAEIEPADVAAALRVLQHMSRYFESMKGTTGHE